MDILGTEDPEDMETIICRLKQKSVKQDDDVYYHEDTDMWLDDELMALDEYDRNELCRNIGMAGEQYAFELVCQELLNQGYEIREKKDGLLTLTGEKGEYTVFRPDTGRYHQAGWDIRVTGRLFQSRRKETGI